MRKKRLPGMAGWVEETGDELGLERSNLGRDVDEADATEGGREGGSGSVGVKTRSGGGRGGRVVAGDKGDDKVGEEALKGWRGANKGGMVPEAGREGLFGDVNAA